jgi:hypothetical protein
MDPGTNILGESARPRGDMCGQERVGHVRERCGPVSFSNSLLADKYLLCATNLFVHGRIC